MLSISDWRAMVDVVLIDTDYNTEVFNITLSDIPERKNDLVSGVTSWIHRRGRQQSL
jgi:F420-0:gamma-glutamyl ligase-like protein